MCVLSGAVSASWDILLVLGSSSGSVTKADSLGREDGRIGDLSFLDGSNGHDVSDESTALTFAVFPDKPDTDRSLSSLPKVDTPLR